MSNRNFCDRQRYRATPETQSNFTPQRERECGEEEEEKKQGTVVATVVVVQQQEQWYI